MTTPRRDLPPPADRVTEHRRSARRLRWVSLPLIVGGFVLSRVGPAWFAGILTILGVIACVAMVERRAWADGYETRQREKTDDA